MKRNRSGQGVVEFALILPIFMFILLGIYDFCRAFHSWSNLNFQCVQAARAGTKRINQMIARDFYGQFTHAPLADVQNTFWQYRSPLMIQSEYSDFLIGGVGTTNVNVEVSARYTLDLITPGAASLVGQGPRPGTITIAAYAQEQKE